MDLREGSRGVCTVAFLIEALRDRDSWMDTQKR